MALRRPGIEHLLSAIGGTEGGMPPEAAPEAAQGGMPEQAQPPGASGPLPVGMGGSSAGLSNQALEGMTGAGQSEEEAQYEQMEAAMEDPNTPPEVKQVLQMQLAMAARRNLSLGGASG